MIKRKVSPLLLFPFLAVLMTLGVSAQDYVVNSESGTVEFTRIGEVAGSKDELFTKAKLWVASTFKSTPSVIQTEDRSEGFLILKGNVDYKMNYSITNGKGKKTTVATRPAKGNADFTLKIFVKDGKYKILITDISVPLSEYFYQAGQMDDKLLWDNKRIERELNPIGDDQLEKDLHIQNYKNRAEALATAFIEVINSLYKQFSKKAENDF